MNFNRDSRGRGGFALLEVMLSLAILSTFGTASLWFASESVRSVHGAHRDEVTIRRANRLMTSVSLWPTEDLVRHLGITEQGPFLLSLERGSTALYRVVVLQPVPAGGVAPESVARRAAASKTLLRTVLYKR